MSYTKTVWRNNQAPAINADNLNHIEQGIKSAHDQIAINTSDIETLTTQVQGNAGNIASEISARQSGDSSLQSQIDQIIAPTGEAPSAAEVENARIGDDGVTYDTLGNAIRGQFADVKSVLNDDIGAIPYAGGTATLGNDPTADTSKLYYVNLPNNARHRTIMYYDTSSASWQYGAILDRLIDLETKKDAQQIRNYTDYIRGSVLSLKELVFRQGYYIKNNEDIGQTVDTTEVVNAYYWCLKVSCKKGQKFVITVHGGSTPRAYSFIDVNSKLVEVSPADTNYNGQVLYAPCDGYFICNNKSDYTSAVAKAEDFIILTEHYADESVTPPKTSFFEATSHNMINPTEINFDIYWSPMQGKLATSSSGTKIATTGFIEVEEGETYCFSGTAISSGAYFVDGTTRAVGTAGISITYFDPVSGSGNCFTVPSGYKYVCLNLNTNDDKTVINGTYQLEKGEMATPIVPYELVYKIESQYLPDVAAQTVASIDTLPRPSYVSEYSKIANFMEHMMAKDKDLMMIGTGTSLTARSSEHCTLRADATSRPPLLHSNNFASDIWDRVKWDGQQYRRFDYTGFFTETGTFESSANDSNWDDANYRYGITRFATGSASVAFTVPEDAWQFNFIYRTDTNGSESVSVAISEGNGKMEVWNGSAWVEANGYTFSMKETAIVLSNIEVCDPNTINNSKVSQSSYQVGGNTTYQKRLKMRCKSSLIDSRDITKAVTISSTSGRLLYWGVEWSPREFMLTYVNAARGSHNMSYQASLSLSHFQDNEIWSFKPDLIFTENPIHNSGAAGSDLASYRTTYWGYSTYDFFFNTDNPISLASRAAYYGITNLEWIVFTSSLSWNFGGIDDNGELKLYKDKDGRVLSALDAQTLCHAWTLENEPTVISINACKFWCDAGRKLFDNLKDATVGSGKNGNTFTNEGSHWNDTGSAIIDRCVGGVFDFYN